MCFIEPNPRPWDMENESRAAMTVRLARACAEPWLCFILPVSTFFFLSLGPHGGFAALAWTLPVWLCVAADYVSPADRRVPWILVPQWGLDARLCVLFALQWVNIVLLLDAGSRLAWDGPAEFAASAANVVAMRILVGTNSCCSALAVAHELVHRRGRHWRWMGRMLLWTVCYDHFALAHGRGHHRLASTLADPATARFGERFEDFLKRSIRGQWMQSWDMETRRLRMASRRGLGLWLRHRVAHGLLAEAALLGWIVACFGGVALLLFLWQAFAAVRLLESVNYVQHWGLVRAGPGFGPADAWSCDSWFTLHAFIGLSRHADHHACGGKPSMRLLHRGEGPRLPKGYFVMALWLRCCNERFMELATRELEVKGLGPFRPG